VQLGGLPDIEDLDAAVHLVVRVDDHPLGRIGVDPISSVTASSIWIGVPSGRV
jgi:hypothetical protein